MASQCDKLWAMLTSEMGDAGIEELDMSNYSCQAVEKMLEYFYFGNTDLEDLSSEALLELIRKLIIN